MHGWFRRNGIYKRIYSSRDKLPLKNIRNIYLSICIVSLIALRLIPNNVIGSCTYRYTSFQCDYFEFIKIVFFGTDLSIILLLIAFFSLYKVIVLNHKSKKVLSKINYFLREQENTAHRTGVYANTWGFEHGADSAYHE